MAMIKAAVEAKGTESPTPKTKTAAKVLETELGTKKKDTHDIQTTTLQALKARQDEAVASYDNLCENRDADLCDQQLQSSEAVIKQAALVKKETQMAYNREHNYQLLRNQPPVKADNKLKIQYDIMTTKCHNKLRYMVLELEIILHSVQTLEELQQFCQALISILELPENEYLYKVYQVLQHSADAYYMKELNMYIARTFERVCLQRQNEGLAQFLIEKIEQQRFNAGAARPSEFSRADICSIRSAANTMQEQYEQQKEILWKNSHCKPFDSMQLTFSIEIKDIIDNVNRRHLSKDFHLHCTMFFKEYEVILQPPPRTIPLDLRDGFAYVQSIVTSTSVGFYSALIEIYKCFSPQSTLETASFPGASFIAGLHALAALGWDALLNGEIGASEYPLLFLEHPATMKESAVIEVLTVNNPDAECQPVQLCLRIINYFLKMQHAAGKHMILHTYLPEKCGLLPILQSIVSFTTASTRSISNFSSLLEMLDKECRSGTPTLEHFSTSSVANGVGKSISWIFPGLVQHIREECVQQNYNPIDLVEGKPEWMQTLQLLISGYHAVLPELDAAEHKLAAPRREVLTRLETAFGIMSTGWIQSLWHLDVPDDHCITRLLMSTIQFGENLQYCNVSDEQVWHLALLLHKCRSVPLKEWQTEKSAQQLWSSLLPHKVFVFKQHIQKSLCDLWQGATIDCGSTIDYQLDNLLTDLFMCTTTKDIHTCLLEQLQSIGWTYAGNDRDGYTKKSNNYVCIDSAEKIYREIAKHLQKQLLEILMQENISMLVEVLVKTSEMHSLLQPVPDLNALLHKVDWDYAQIVEQDSTEANLWNAVAEYYLHTFGRATCTYSTIALNNLGVSWSADWTDHHSLKHDFNVLTKLPRRLNNFHVYHLSCQLALLPRTGARPMHHRKPAFESDGRLQLYLFYPHSDSDALAFKLLPAAHIVKVLPASDKTCMNPTNGANSVEKTTLWSNHQSFLERFLMLLSKDTVFQLHIDHDEYVEKKQYRSTGKTKTEKEKQSLWFSESVCDAVADVVETIKDEFGVLEDMDPDCSSRWEKCFRLSLYVIAKRTAKDDTEVHTDRVYHLYQETATMMESGILQAFTETDLKHYLHDQRRLQDGRCKSVLLHALTMQPVSQCSTHGPEVDGNEAWSKVCEWIDRVCDDYAKMAGIEIPNERLAADVVDVQLMLGNIMNPKGEAVSQAADKMHHLTRILQQNGMKKEAANVNKLAGELEELRNELLAMAWSQAAIDAAVQKAHDTAAAVLAMAYFNVNTIVADAPPLRLDVIRVIVGMKFGLCASAVPTDCSPLDLLLYKRLKRVYALESTRQGCRVSSAFGEVAKTRLQGVLRILQSLKKVPEGLQRQLLYTCWQTWYSDNFMLTEAASKIPLISQRISPVLQTHLQACLQTKTLQKVGPVSTNVNFVLDGKQFELPLQDSAYFPMAQIADDGKRWLNFDDILYSKVDGITQCNGIGGLNHAETKRAIEQLYQAAGCNGMAPQEPTDDLRCRQIHPDCKRVLQLLDALGVDNQWIRKYTMSAFTLHTDETRERMLQKWATLHHHSEGIQSFFDALERDGSLELKKDEISQLIISLIDPGCGMRQGFCCMDCGNSLPQRDDVVLQRCKKCFDGLEKSIQKQEKQALNKWRQTNKSVIASLTNN